MKIAIAGYGQEGESSYRYWSKDPLNKIIIADQKRPARPVPKGVDAIFGDEHPTLH